MQGRSLLIALTALLAACGARTGLLVNERDGDADIPVADADTFPDADDADIEPDVNPPGCWVPLAPGEIRARLSHVIGRVAVDREGTIYAPMAEFGGVDLGAIDACGELLWQEVALPESGESGQPQAHLYRRDEVMLSATWGGLANMGMVRFSRDGERLPDFPLDGNISNLVGVPSDYGPVLRSYDGDDEVTYLSRLTPEVEDRVAIYGMPDSPEAGLVWRDECAIFARQITCFDVAFDLDTLEERWRYDPRIVDGTLRHVIPPALFGNDSFATIMYGISTYQLVLRSTVTGEQLWRETLVRSESGQEGLLTGAPIVSNGGRLISYINSGTSGTLRAHREDGSELWSLRADATERQFFYYATHVAGDDGLIYLAIGPTVYAVDEEDGSIRWQRDDLGAFHGRSVTLSPTGDLVLLNDNRELLIIATSASGPARSSWPAPGGGPRNDNAS